MADVPNKSTVTYTATVNHTQYVGFGTPSGLVADAKAALRPQGVTVITFSSSSEALASITGGSFTLNMQIHVENGLGFDSEESLRNVVDDAIESTGTGVSVVSSDVLSIQTPDGAVTKTSANADKPQTSGCISGSGNDLNGNFSLSCCFGNLTGKGLSTVGLLTIVAVLGVGLFVLSGASSASAAITTLSRRVRRAVK